MEATSTAYGVGQSGLGNSSSEARQGETAVAMLMDIYALAPERSVGAVERFLDRFLPRRSRADADYWVTLGSVHPAAVFDTPEDLARFCEANREAEARAYWLSDAEGDPCSAHVFFLPSGGLVVGLSVAANDEAAWDKWLEELKSFVGAEHGYWTGECPPEDTVTEFVAVAERACRTRR